jgi:hypothetical protein
MALYASLAELKEAVRFEVKRMNNAQFDQALPRLVAQAEHRMWFGSDDPLKASPLRLRVMERSETLTLAGGAVTLPDDYLEARRLQWNGSPRTSPIYEAPHSFFVSQYQDQTGSPVRFTIEGSDLLVSPKASGDIEFLYYARPEALEDETDTNAVLSAFPMIYFQAVLLEAHAFLRNADEMQKAFGAYVSLAGGAGRSDGTARRAFASPMAPRIPGWRV